MLAAEQAPQEDAAVTERTDPAKGNFQTRGKTEVEHVPSRRIVWPLASSAQSRAGAHAAETEAA